MTHTKPVRNFSVFCAESMIRIMQDEIEKRAGTSATEFILQNVFKEQTDLETLRTAYSEAVGGKENFYFPLAYFCDKKHAVRIENGKILLYSYQDVVDIGVPWDYPHLITEIGSTPQGSDLTTVMNDLKKRSALDFLLKYYYHQAIGEHAVRTIPYGFVVDDDFEIRIDDHDHITFQILNSDRDVKEKYIADAWNESPEVILHDLLNMDLLKFGKKYLAFWGK